MQIILFYLGGTHIFTTAGEDAYDVHSWQSCTLPNKCLQIEAVVTICIQTMYLILDLMGMTYV